MAVAALVQQLGRIGRRGIGAPLVMLVLLAMVVLPLPPFMLDVLFSFNIALSLVIVLAVVYVMRPLDFGAFPTVVLGATLLRLALNIASTRVVLLHGHNGPGAAGKVIEAFGEFVIGGNFTVGLVVFSILTIINFVVITKGATRVSEVTARFTLDSMPGKQMAIDADLNAGLLTQEQARERRQEVREEADFYGSMDGASKFVRGDATAGILILIINIVGGFAVGVLQHGLSASEAAHTYTLLTIGDGLVAQIPALLLSVATAVIVTRVSRSQDMGKQVLSQVFGQPRALAVTAVVLGVMGVIPGMPNVAFLLLGGICGGAAWLLDRRRRDAEKAARERASAASDAEPTPASERVELSWDDVGAVDTISLEVGYRLIPLVDRNQGGELLGRIKSVRRKLSQDLGFLVPPVHIRDNLDLGPSHYRISLLGVPVGEAEVHHDRLLAINPGDRDRDPPVAHPAGARARGARPPGGAATAGPAFRRSTQAGGRPGSEAPVARRGGQSAAEPARRARADPQHARDRRIAGGARRAKPGFRHLDGHGAGRARPPDRPGIQWLGQ
jgi:flagellar biosynthesis protein FlhA